MNWREIFNYNPETGSLTWRYRAREHFPTDESYRSFNAGRLGREALVTVKSGYHVGKVFGKTYRKHRVIFEYMTGRSVDYVDHINGDRLDNRWCNLREVTAQENARNRKLPRHNTSGRIGVAWNKSSKAWDVRISDNSGNPVHIGKFKLFEDAEQARLEAERKYGYHENHGRQS